MPSSDKTSEDIGQILHNWEEIGFARLVVIAVIAGVLIYLVKWILPWVASKLPERFRFYVLPWVPIFRLLILVAAIVQITPLVIKPTPENLIAVLGATAIALGFAFKDYASSLIAGVVALFEQPYRAGDWVTIDDAYGEVRSLGLRALTMVTPDDTVVTIPHSKIWTTAIRNENAGQRELQCVADFYMRPDHDGETVKQILYDVGMTSPYLHPGRPVIVVMAETPWASHYRLKAYPIDGRNQFLFITDLTIRAKAELRKFDIPFASASAVAGPA